MSPALEKLLRPGLGHPGSPEHAATGSRLHIAVVFTSVDATLTALRKAGTLAASLGGRITLLVPQVVPYPLPLTSPPVLLDWSEKRFRVIAAESPVETAVKLYLCRDRVETLLMALQPRSLVVVGGRQAWWPASEWRLARRLRRSGHEVIYTTE